MEGNDNKEKVKQEQEESNNTKENPEKSDNDKSNEPDLSAIPPLILVTADGAVEPDSTVAEIPVNLKVEEAAGNNGAVEEQEQTNNQDGMNNSSPPPTQPIAAEQERQIRSSPPPLTQHVRTITLTPDYRQLQQHQENNQETAMNEEHQMADGNSAANNATLYVEEGAVDGSQHQETTDNNSYYQHQHYTEENATAQSSVRYREVGDDHKQTGGSVQHTELLDAAAAEAGVPTGYIMMEGEEDDQDDRTSAYIGSRLATFQVYNSYQLS